MKIKFQSRERRSGRQRRRWNRIEFQKKNNNNNNKKHQKQKEILRFEKTEIQGQPVKMTGKLRGETTTKKKKKRKWKCATRTVKCASLTWTTHARAKLFFVFLRFVFCFSSFRFVRFLGSTAASRVKSESGGHQQQPQQQQQQQQQQKQQQQQQQQQPNFANRTTLAGCAESRNPPQRRCRRRRARVTDFSATYFVTIAIFSETRTRLREERERKKTGT